MRMLIVARSLLRAVAENKPWIISYGLVVRNRKMSHFPQLTTEETTKKEKDRFLNTKKTEKKSIGKKEFTH
jgi:hypothetical protein